MPDIKRRLIIDTKSVKDAQKAAENLLKKTNELEKKRTAIARREAAQRIQNLRKLRRQGLINEQKFANDVLKVRKDLSVKTIAIEERTQKRIARIRQAANKRAQAAGKEIGGGLSSGLASLKNIVGAGVIVTAGQQFLQLGGAALDAASKFEQAQKGLIGTARAFGQSAGEATAAANELAADGLLTFSDSAEILKSLISTGFDVSESLKLAKGIKDTASFNRVTENFAQSIKDSARGIRTQSVELIENAGLVTKVGAALNKAGFETADLSDKTKGAAARAALYNIVLEDTAKFAGDAAKFSETYAGAQARLQASTTRLLESLGEILKDGLQPITVAFANVVGKITQFTETLKNTAAGRATIKILFAPLLFILASLKFTFESVVGAITFFVDVYTLFINAIERNQGLNALAAILLRIGEVIKNFLLAPFRALGALFTKIQELFADDGFAKGFESAMESAANAILGFIAVVKVAGTVLSAFFKAGINQLKAYAAATTLNFAEAKRAFEDSIQNTKDLIDATKNFGANVKKEFDKLRKNKLPPIVTKETVEETKKRAKEEAQAVKDTRKAVLETTTAQTLQDEIALIEKRLEVQADGLQRIALQERQFAAQAQLDAIQQTDELTRLEVERFELTRRLARAKTRDQKIALKDEIRLANIGIKVEKNSVAAKAKLQSDFQGLRKRLADGGAEAFADAILKEKNAFAAFLGFAIKQFTRFIAAQLTLRATANFASPFTAPIAVAQLAAAGVVIAAGEVAASALTKDDEQVAAALNVGGVSDIGTATAGIDTSPTFGGTGGAATTINNITNITNTIEQNGTFLDEADAIRNRLDAAFQELDVERGRVTFAG